MGYNGDNLGDGFSRDELLAIGQRKVKLGLNMTASDINSPMTHDMVTRAAASMPGFTDDELKIIGERGAQAPVMRPCYINEMPVNVAHIGAVESVLLGLQKFLGVRTS